MPRFVLIENNPEYPAGDDTRWWWDTERPLPPEVGQEFKAVQVYSDRDANSYVRHAALQLLFTDQMEYYAVCWPCFDAYRSMQWSGSTRGYSDCRVEGNKDPKASIFVKGDMKTGKFCAECLIVDFFKNFDIGPSSALGKEYFDHTLPQPEWRKDVGDKDKRFDPACLREPHVQQHMVAIIQTAARVHGAQLTFEEIDWDEVIANWHLPFPEKPKGRGKRKSPPADK